jgi:hypothetical protein
MLESLAEQRPRMGANRDGTLMFCLPSDTIQILSRHWSHRLAHFRQHHNDEHREALISEALRFAGFRLESELAECAYWSDAPLDRRVAVLLYLLDRGAVVRAFRNGRVVFEPTDGAEGWVRDQLSLAPYAHATLELIAALRREQDRNSASAK